MREFLSGVFGNTFFPSPRRPSQAFLQAAGKSGLTLFCFFVFFFLHASAAAVLTKTSRRVSHLPTTSGGGGGGHLLFPLCLYIIVSCELSQAWKVDRSHDPVVLHQRLKNKVQKYIRARSVCTVWDSDNSSSNGKLLSPLQRPAASRCLCQSRGADYLVCRGK